MLQIQALLLLLQKHHTDLSHCAMVQKLTTQTLEKVELCEYSLLNCYWSPQELLKSDTGYLERHRVHLKRQGKDRHQLCLISCCFTSGITFCRTLSSEKPQTVEAQNIAQGDLALPGEKKEC